jgi:hypothetical protein
MQASRRLASSLQWAKQPSADELCRHDTAMPLSNSFFVLGVNDSTPFDRLSDPLRRVERAKVEGRGIG